MNAGRLLPTQDYLPGCSLPAHLSPFSDSKKSTEAWLNYRGGLTDVAPGFGAGVLDYRPPEADYLEGLVSLAEIRGKSIHAQPDDDPDISVMNVDDDLDEPDQTVLKAANCSQESNNMDKKKKKNNTKLKKIRKG